MAADGYSEARWNTRSPDPRVAELEAQLAARGPYMPVDPTVMVTGPGRVSDRTVYSVGETLAEKGEG